MGTATAQSMRDFERARNHKSFVGRRGYLTQQLGEELGALLSEWVLQCFEAEFRLLAC